MIRTTALLFLLGFAGILRGQTLSVETIVKRTDSTYANASTYRDSGNVYRSFENDGRINSRNSFKTEFKRGVFIRFAFLNQGESYSYRAFQWDSTGTLHGYSWLKRWVKKNGDLGSEVAAATGVSFGAAHTIPRMLLPDVLTGRHILRKNQPDTLLGIEVVNGHNCYAVGRKIGGSGAFDHLNIIWIDQDSFLIRRIGDPAFGNYTLYYPSINLPLEAGAELVPFKSDARKVFWKTVFLEWSPLIALVLFLAYQGFGYLLKRRNHISNRSFLGFVFLNPGSKKIFKYLILLYVFLPRAIIVGIIPSQYLALLLSLIPMSLLVLLWQYLVLPDWFFRQRELYFDVASLILSLGAGIIFIYTAETGTIKLDPELIFFLIFLVVNVIGIRYYRRRKGKQELVQQTRYEGERERSIWTEGSLLETKSVLLGNRKGGRLILFNDHLVYVPKLGAPVSIPFRTIRNIRVIREWLIIPVGLQMTDYRNESRYLALQFPFYWKSRIKRL